MTKVPGSNSEQAALSNMELLRSNPYPGRGIVTGFNKRRDQAIQVYWVMGRSDNSRNRILAQEGDLIKTRPFDPSKVQDPKLIIYTAMRNVDGRHIVSNGDQTDSIADMIEKGGTFKEGLGKITYEPDKPNYTPRITSECYPYSEIPFSISVVRKDPSSMDPIRTLKSYELKAGIGQCVHTYKGDGDPLPSFDSDPFPVILDGSVDQIAQTYWNLLNADNRVALVVKGIDTETGKVSYKIINAHDKLTK